MLTPAQDLTVARFAASWTRLNTTAHHENAPANCLRIQADPALPHTDFPEKEIKCT